MTAPFKPMLCHDAKEVGFPEPASEWVLEGKFDGWRALVSLSDARAVLYGGRNGSSYAGKVPYIEEAIAGALPPDTVIDGELIAPSMKCGDVQSIMRDSRPHRPSAFSPHLTLVVFDVLMLNGATITNLPWVNRRALLELIEWPAHTYLSPTGEATEANHTRMLDLGLEGSVLKRKTSAYHPAVRSRDWLKLKAIASEDCIITAVLPGEGESNRDKMGAFEVMYDVRVDHALKAGMRTTIKIPDDATVTVATANPDEFLGRTVEVVHNGVFDSGKLRHPRFFRWREDRDQPAPAPTPTRPRRTSGGGKKMRAYNLMGRDKLLACLSELNGGYGDAYHVAMSGKHAGDLSDHIAAATEAARKKGLL